MKLFIGYRKVVNETNLQVKNSIKTNTENIEKYIYGCSLYSRNNELLYSNTTTGSKEGVVPLKLNIDIFLWGIKAVRKYLIEVIKNKSINMLEEEEIEIIIESKALYRSLESPKKARQYIRNIEEIITELAYMPRRITVFYVENIQHKIQYITTVECKEKYTKALDFFKEQMSQV